jgi:para-nitrobenzyl esterase
MLASPLAAGLFQRGILESGPCAVIRPMSLSSAEGLGTTFAAAAGFSQPATLVACLRKAPTATLVAAAQKDIINAPAFGTPALPNLPFQAMASSHWNKVPLLIGSVLNEGKLFFDTETNLTAAQYTAAIESQYGSDAAQILAHYPVRNYPAPFYARAAVFTDSLFACPSYWAAGDLAAQVPVWEEEFDDPTSSVFVSNLPAGINMANAHAAELGYLWNVTYGYRPSTVQLRLGDQMDRYWGAFARTANPNVPGQVAWTMITAGTHPVIDFHPAGSTVSTTVFPAEHQCSFWAPIEPYFS